MKRFHLFFSLFVGLPPTFAQEASPEEDSVQLQEFVAESSFVQQVEAAFESRSVPVQVIDREQMDRAGFTTVEEYFQNLTINGGGGVPMQNNQTGSTPAASSISLRGAGPDYTLVLINGKRLASYPVGSGVSAFVDLSSLPASSIERVEILKDSGTALFGADAVAGVINIITKKDYDGAELLLRYGNDTSDTDSSEFYTSLTFGLDDPRGNISGNLFYLKKNSIFQSNRHFSATPPFLSSNAIPMNAQITAAAARDALGLGPDDPIPGLDLPDSPSPQDRIILATSGPSRPDGTRLERAVIDGNDGALGADRYTYLGTWGFHSRYNYNALAQSTPRIERMGAYLNFNRRLFDSDHYSIQGDLSYTRAEALNSLAPTATGNFHDFSGGTSIVVPARTPFPINRPDVLIDGKLRAGYTAYAGGDGILGNQDDIYRLDEVAPGAHNPHNPFNQDLEGASRIRLEEFGLRTADSVTDAYYTTWALEGRDLEIAGDGWNFDLGFRYSLVDIETDSRLVSKSRLNRLMNAEDPWFDPDSPEYLGTTIPYNPFGASQFDGYFNENNRMIADNAKVTLNDVARSDLFVGYLDLFSDDIHDLPGGSIVLRLGYDWRRENVEQSPDPRNTSGDVAWGTSTSTDADRYIHGGYADALIPIIGPEMDSFIHAWDVSLTGRMDHFITTDRTSLIPKISTRILPIRQVALRGSWGKGYREPSLFENYLGSISGLYSLTNPWNPGDRNPEIDVTLQGNPLLDPVDSESYNLGIVYTPDYVKGLSMSLDYWVLERENFVIVDPQDTVNRIFNGHPTDPGEMVHLDSQNNLLLVETVFLNSGYNRTRGIDILASYTLPTRNSGTFDWFFEFTWLIDDISRINPYRPLFDYAGYGTGTDFELREQDQGGGLPIGTQDGQTLVISRIGSNNDAYLEYRFNTTFAWSYRNFNITMLGRYTSGFADIGPDLTLTRVEDRLLWDMQTSYTFLPDATSWYGNTTLTFGIENLFDTDPPSAFAYYNNPNGYPGFLYEPDGQRYYLSLRKSF